MKRFFLILIFVFGYINLQAQTTIAKQSFEASGDTWLPLSFSTPPCTVGNDIWNYSTNLPGISPNEGSQFWGIRDLNGSCGGNDFETITLPNVDISSFTDVEFSFDYNAINFDNNEDLKYELFFNGVSQGEVIVVNGVGGGSDNTNGWLTETVSIPNSINSVSVALSARCNANNERAGFDNVVLTESSTSGLANDDCANAVTLTVGTNNNENLVTGTNVGSTSSGELPNPNCGNYLGNDIWYTAQVPASGIITVETQSVSGSSLDPSIEIYSGSCGSFTRLACNDDINYPSDLNSQIELTGLPNTTIYIRLWAWSNNSTGDVNIVAYSNPTPSNNDCLAAQSLVVGTTNSQNVVTGTNEGATDSGVALPNNCDQYLGGDVWYTAQIPASGVLNIETSNAGGITDTGVAVYTGSCGSLTQIDCDADSGPGFFSTINITGLPNTLVYIRVWEYQNNNFGEFNIVAYSPECPFTTTWDGNSWNNGIPNEFTSVIINGNYDTASNGSFNSCNCTINTGDIVNIRANNYISIENDLTVNGTLEVRHEGSLVMVEDDGIVTSTGTINIHKTTTPLNRYDYIYWSSPTQNQTLGNAYPSYNANRTWIWDSILTAWIPTTNATVMEQGLGYVVSVDEVGPYPKIMTPTFEGIVNSGIIETPVGVGSTAYSYWNIIGNPYPSALDADSFLNNPLNNSLISGTIYLWTHGTEIAQENPDDNYYQYTVNDYATYTAGTGGVAANSGGDIPNGYLASGQGFLVGAFSSGSVTYNNSMRVVDNNDQFFKSNSAAQKKRIWLDLYNDKGAFSQILVGFIEGASNDYDRYDGDLNSNGFVGFYSLVDDNFLAIQGKKNLLNEDINITKLGYYSNIDESDSLKISIRKIEGINGEYTIYLKDKKLNILHNLETQSYDFHPGTNGNHKDRFELVLIKSQVLNTEEINSSKNELSISQLENSVEIKTTNSNTISQLKIYDLLGKIILDDKPNASTYSLKTNNLAEGTILLLNVTLDTNEILTKKIIVY